MLSERNEIYCTPGQFGHRVSSDPRHGSRRFSTGPLTVPHLSVGTVDAKDFLVDSVIPKNMDIEIFMRDDVFQHTIASH